MKNLDISLKPSKEVSLRGSFLIAHCAQSDLCSCSYGNVSAKKIFLMILMIKWQSALKRRISTIGLSGPYWRCDEFCGLLCRWNYQIFWGHQRFWSNVPDNSFQFFSPSSIAYEKAIKYQDNIWLRTIFWPGISKPEHRRVLSKLIPPKKSAALLCLRSIPQMLLRIRSRWPNE